MKYLKIFGLAAIAAMALMAFVGAGSASATVLCEITPTEEGLPNEGECPEEFAVDEIEASLTGTAILETTSGSPPTVLDTCTVGRVKSHTTTKGSTTETATGPIDELFWGEVTKGCTKTTDTLANESEPKFGELEIHSIGDTHNGTVTAKNAKVTVNTIFGSCVYGTGAELDLGILKGGSPATLEINTTVKKQPGGNAACPAETRWTANYAVTGPGSLWVATGIEP